MKHNEEEVNERRIVATFDNNELAQLLVDTVRQKVGLSPNEGEGKAEIVVDRDGLGYERINRAEVTIVVKL